MSKFYQKAAALALAATMVLGGCSKAEEKEPAKDNTTTTTPPVTDAKPETPAAPVKKDGSEIKDLVLGKLATRELTTFNILYSQDAAIFENLTNLTDGLLEVNNKGQLVPSIAESWETQDGGKTWTFKLRDNAKWVDVNGKEKAVCNAYDFATGLEWVLNYHKNESANTSMPIEMIEGAGEYYEYTKSLSKEEAEALAAGPDSKFMELVGLDIPDPLTLVYTCITEKPYFDTLGAYCCLYPMAQGMVDELGSAEAVRAMTNENMWYNGCYTMTEYIQGNEKVFTKNPMYWDTNCTLFDTVTIRMIESNDVGYQLFESGEIDYIDLTESNLKTITDDPNHKFYNYRVPAVPSKYSYQIHFNYNKMNEDGTPDTNWNTAIANEAFRKSWYYGLELTDYYKRTNTLDPLACENNAYTMQGLVYFSDGREYTQVVRDKLGLPEPDGTKMARYDAAKGAEYKKQAMEELSALGVTFPVGIDYYIAGGSQTALDSANVLSNCFSKSLGDDFVKLNIKTYVSSFSKEVRTPKLHSLATNGWGADYGDPQNYMGQETYGYDNAYYAKSYSNINDLEENEATKALLDTYKEYTKMVEAADAITTDVDKRYEAYADAEAYMIEHALVVPLNYGKGWALSKYDLNTKANAMFGCCNDKMKNWATNSNGYTTQEAENWFKK